MTIEKIKSLIALGENIAVEFKRCGNGIEKDVYQTVCSFSNRFGGDIFCGVLDDGTIAGVPESSAQFMVNNFINVISNENLFFPKLFIMPEIVLIDGKTIIHIHVPFSSELCMFKKEIYDRIGDSDIVVKTTSKISELVLRKQNIYTERKVFPYASIEDLDSRLISKARQMAVNKNNNHPWRTISDEELLRSAKLMGEDLETGRIGINRAGILLLGKDSAISSVCPAYKTDALLRRVNLDRYDDRAIIATNLLDSYDMLIQFAQKHLWDKFYMEGTQTVSLRDKIVREMVSNVLMHREFTSPFISKFVIEESRMYTENPCKAQNHAELTPETFTPVSKNPIIANFFTQIGNADELGSGTRNLFKYTILYSGKNPKMTEDEIFRCEIPLDNEYSADANKTDVIKPSKDEYLSETQRQILSLMKENPSVTLTQISHTLGIAVRTVERNAKELKLHGIIARSGSKKDGHWVIK